MKKKDKKPEFKVGKRIKEIQIDKKQHVVELSFAVSIFAVLMLGGLISLGAMVNRWYVWFICGILLLYFITHAVISIIKASRNPKYLLCENCLIVNSIWHFGIVKLDTIQKMEIKTTIFDNIQKDGMQSLAIYYKDNEMRKITLHSITEDLNALVEEINSQAKKFNEFKDEKSGN